MKKIILSTLFFLCLQAVTFAQGWAPSGARWLYNYTAIGHIQPFTSIKYTSDTLINNKNVKKFDAETFYYITDSGGITGSTPMQYVGSFFMYEENDVVYWWVNNQFEPLYYFNAQIGDRWPISKPDGTLHDCDTTAIGDTVVVEAIINANLFGHTYKKITTRNLQGQWQIFYYIEDIGGEYGFVPFPEMMSGLCNSGGVNTGYNYAGELWCYYDDIRGHRKIFPGGQECNMAILTDLEEVKIASSTVSNISIYPNPVLETIKINNLTQEKTVQSFSIYNIIGQKLMDNSLENDLIEVGTLSKGMYILTLHGMNGAVLFSTKFIKE
jgi:hypothetical protein